MLEYNTRIFSSLIDSLRDRTALEELELLEGDEPFMMMKRAFSQEQRNTIIAAMTTWIRLKHFTFTGWFDSGSEEAYLLELNSEAGQVNQANAQVVFEGLRHCPALETVKLAGVLIGPVVIDFLDRAANSLHRVVIERPCFSDNQSLHQFTQFLARINKPFCIESGQMCFAEDDPHVLYAFARALENARFDVFIRMPQVFTPPHKSDRRAGPCGFESVEEAPSQLRPVGAQHGHVRTVSIAENQLAPELARLFPSEAKKEPKKEPDDESDDESDEADHPSDHESDDE
ncbi:hypothetical protein HK102_006806, partial [Quaeritorhiza haematococci]